MMWPFNVTICKTKGHEQLFLNLETIGPAKEVRSLIFIGQSTLDGRIYSWPWPPVHG